jgi:succinate dehydrogenase/fumarate reductase cytochrome b subunit
MHRTRPLVLRVAAPLAALAYPGLIWCGVHLSPVFLAIALAVPAVGLVAAYRLGSTGAGGPPAGSPTGASALARWIAHLAVAAPPLFALLGGWLDFQRAVPVGSLGVWLPLWSALTVAAALAGGRQGASPVPPPAGDGERIRPRRRWLVAAHASSAAAITLFAAAHIANHLGGLFGGAAHTAMMNALRAGYRHPLVEPALLAAVGFQVASGACLVQRKLRLASGWYEALQTATGVYLMLFLISHVSAVLRARLLRHHDTDWSWLAGGELLSDPWSARLVPYYFLAVIALAVHGGCGLRVVMLGHGVSPSRCGALVTLLAAAAALGSALILLGLFRAG